MVAATQHYHSHELTMLSAKYIWELYGDSNLRNMFERIIKSFSARGRANTEK